MFKDYYIKKLIIKDGGVNNFILESFKLSKKLYDIRNYILQNIDQIIDESWGKFSKDFIRKHIIFSKRLLILRIKDRIVAIAAASDKKLAGKKVLYLEFTVVHPEFRGLNILSRLNALFIGEFFLKNLISTCNLSIEIMTITPSMRVLASLANVASFIYPNPFKANSEGRIIPADEQTYVMAKELIAISNDPNRHVKREGLVLIGSYRNTPWLIQEKPLKYYDERVNLFCKKYIEYDKRSDKEFIVRAKITLISFVKFFIKKLKKIDNSSNNNYNSRNINTADTTIKRTKNQFDEWADKYDQGVWHKYFIKSNRKAVELVKFGKGSRILDLGCGTGELSSELAQNSDVDQVIGVDISNKMIEKAKSKLQKLDYSFRKKVKFIKGQSDKLEFPDNYFDIIFCLNSFHHYPDQNKTLEEMSRILKKNGLFLILDPFRDNFLRKLWSMILKKIFNEDYAIYHTKKSLNNLFSQHGYELTNQKTFLYFTLFSLFKKIRI